MTPPLTGLRVLELANLMAGPFCGLVLADLGADVVKIENPQGGDFSRATPPSVRGSAPASWPSTATSAAWPLDLKAPAGGEVFPCASPAGRTWCWRTSARGRCVTWGSTTRPCARTIPASSTAPSPATGSRALQPARRARSDHAGHVRDHERHRGARADPRSKWASLWPT